MRKFSHIGHRQLRLEDRAFLLGAGRFVDDIRKPNLVEAAFFRSPVAHGLIRSIDVSRARALDGVCNKGFWER